MQQELISKRCVSLEPFLLVVKGRNGTVSSSYLVGSPRPGALTTRKLPIRVQDEPDAFHRVLGLQNEIVVISPLW